MADIVPGILYKYLPPERLDVLTNGWLRVSQRQVVNDYERDFQPSYHHAAPPEVLAQFLDEQVARDSNISEQDRPAFVQFLIERFGSQMRDMTVGALKMPDMMGMVCLTDSFVNEVLWCRYAACKTGFVLGLDVSKLAGTIIPRLEMRKVIYSDKPVKYVSEGVFTRETFFRKNTSWAEESEWRGLGLLSKFPVMLKSPSGWPIHACSLPAGVVRTVIIRDECRVTDRLSQLLAVDSRYRDTQLLTL